MIDRIQMDESDALHWRPTRDGEVEPNAAGLINQQPIEPDAMLWIPARLEPNAELTNQQPIVEPETRLSPPMWDDDVEPNTSELTNQQPIPYIELPPELLCKIFIACAAPPSKLKPDALWSDSYRFSAESIQWIAVSHVCRYWRYVALDCAELWRRLVFFNLDVTKEMIHRSKGANLEVIIIEPPWSKPSANEVLQTLRPVSYRISVLRLETCNYPSFYDTIVSAAPKLESLTLSFHDDYYRPRKLSVPDTIFSLQTPALRSLELRDCVLASPSPSSIISRIISFLRQTPMLHTLILHVELPEDLSADIEYMKVVLPVLSELDLSGSIAFCTNLLERLVFPITTAAMFNCIREPTPQDGNYHGLFHAFRSAIGNGEVEFIVSALSIHRNWKSGFCLGYEITYPQSCTQTVIFRFKGIDNLFENDRGIFDAAKITFPLTDVHELVVGRLNDESFWLTIVHDLPNLHGIRFAVLPPSFIAALGDRDSLIMPHLHSLQFNNADFGFQGTSNLLNCLEARFHHGLPINTIHLRQCLNLFEEDVTHMKEFVQVVDWDGVEDYYDDDFYNECGADFDGYSSD
jgi:F-box-like